MENDKELEKQYLADLSKKLTQHTSTISKVSRTWALTIIVPFLPMLSKNEEVLYSIWPIIIIGLSLFSLLIDATQYLYASVKTKYSYDLLSSQQLSLKEVYEREKKVYETTFFLVVLKYCILTINTVLFLVFCITECIK